MALIRDEGFVITTMDWKETSRIARCFTKEHGKLGVIAKGIRRTGSRFGSSLDSFSHLKLIFYLRSGAGLATLKEVETLGFFPKLRTDLRRFAMASFFFEILDRGLPAHEKQPGLFNLTGRFLRYLDADEFQPEACPPFFMQLVAGIGFAPRLDKCCTCGSHDGLVFFDPARGGAVCERCQHKVAGLLSLPEQLRVKMAAALSEPPSEIPQHIFPEGTMTDFYGIIRKLTEYHIEAGLKSADFLLMQIAPPE